MTEQTLQIIVNITVPALIAWASWLTSRVMGFAAELERKRAEHASIHKELERLSAEVISQRNGYGELASALARLSAQTEMVLVILEQLKTEIRSK